MLWEFTNSKNITGAGKKICCVCGQVVITEREVWNWFSKFCSGNTSLRDERWSGCSSDLDQDALRELVECNLFKSIWDLALDLKTSKSIICCHLKKYKKSKQADHTP